MEKLILILLLISQYAFGQGIDNGKQINSELKVGIKIPVSGVTYSAEATQYFNRMTVKPSADTLAMIAEFIDSLKLCGVWDKLDVLCLLANSDTTNALLNLKGSSFTGIRINAPTFTAWKGIAGTTNKYINTQFNPVTDSSSHYYRLNSASYGVYSNTATGMLNSVDMGLNISGNYTHVLSYTGTEILFSVNKNSNTAKTSTSSLGLITVTRTSSTAIASYRDATSLGSASVTSGTIPNGNFYVCGRNDDGTQSSPSTRQYALYFIGGGLTAQNVIDFNSAVTKLKTKIGF